jgi:hypothetical protein
VNFERFLSRLSGAVLLVLLLAAATVAAPVVTLPADPPTTRTAPLQELWRIGGEDDEDVLLGLIGGGALDDDGNAYLIDRQLSEVLVISPAGELLRTLGREGDGPGEFRRASGVILTPTGVGVVQVFPGKVVLINHDGSPGGEIKIGGDAEEGGFRFLRRLACDGEHVVCQSGRATFDREAGKSVNTTSLLVMDLDGKQLAEFGPHTTTRDLQKFVFDEKAQFAEHNAWTLSDDGRIYGLGAREEYRINVRDLQGNLVQVLERPFKTRTRDQEDKDRLLDNMRIMINGQRMEVENKALDTDPAIGGLDGALDGRLFVTNCYGNRERLATGTAGRFDVIGPDGSFAEELTLTFSGFEPELDRLIFLDGEHFLVVRNYGPAEKAMDAGFGGGGEEEEEEDLGDAEPLEVILVRM